MTTTRWNGRNGTWFNPSRWSDGVPAAGDTARFAGQRSFICALNAPAAADRILFNAPSGVLNESASGGLTLTGRFVQKAGTVILEGQNSLPVYHLSGGMLELGDASALGAPRLEFSGGTLAALSGFSEGAFVHASGDLTLAAAAGATFTLTGDCKLVSDAGHPATLAFGAPGFGGAVQLLGRYFLGRTPAFDLTVSQFATLKLASRSAVKLARNAGEITLGDGGLRFYEDARLFNLIDFAGASSLDANGHVVRLSGTLTAEANAAIHLGSAAVSGIIVIDGATFDPPSSGFDVFVDGGRVKAAADHIHTLAFVDMFSDARSVTVGAGAVLDVTGVGNVGLTRLQGAGLISDRGAAVTVDASNLDFHGLLSGDLSFNLLGDADFTGATFATKAGDTLKLGGGEQTLDLSGIHKFVSFSLPTIDLSSSGASLISFAVADQATETLLGFGRGDTIKMDDLPYVDFRREKYVANRDPRTGGRLVLFGTGGARQTLVLRGADYSGHLFVEPDSATGLTVVTTDLGPGPPPAAAKVVALASFAAALGPRGGVGSDLAAGAPSRLGGMGWLAAPGNAPMHHAGPFAALA
ncbi:MAG: hypothetical protein ABI906_07470 [Pseudomonadota bacterium]